MSSLSSQLRQLMSFNSTRVPQLGNNKFNLPQLPVTVSPQFKNKSCSMATITQSDDICCICTHKFSSRTTTSNEDKNSALALPFNSLHHHPDTQSLLTELTRIPFDLDNMNAHMMVLCSVCLGTVLKLLRLEEEVEEVLIRIRAVLNLRKKLEGQSTPQISGSLLHPILEERSKLPISSEIDDDYFGVQIGSSSMDEETNDDIKPILGVGGTLEDELVLEPTSRTTEEKEDLNATWHWIKCYFCHKMFSSHNHLQNHIRSHTLELPFKCEKCGSEFQDPLSLKRHGVSRCVKSESKPENNRVKTNASLHKCHICGTQMTNTTALRTHIRMLHKAKKVDASSLSMNPVTNGRLNCPKCTKTFDNKINLGKHLANIHLLSITKKLTCPICLSCFRNEGVLKAHTHLDPRDRSKVVYTCQVCGQVCKTRDYWSKHMRKGHRDTVTCHKCGMAYKDGRKLEVHRLICTTSDPHLASTKCPVVTCGKEFLTVADRADHVRVVHKGLPSTKCYFCQRILRSTSYLEEHIRCHTTERPYVCELCGQDFTQASSLRTHRVFVCAKNENAREAIRERNERRRRNGEVGKVKLGRPIKSTPGRGETEDARQERLRRKRESGRRKYQLHRKALLCANGMYGAWSRIDVVDFKPSVQQAKSKGDLDATFAQLCQNQGFSTKCYYCHKQHRNPKRLEAHMGIHTLERHRICRKCGKRFSHLRSLNMHMATACGSKTRKKIITRRGVKTRGKINAKSKRPLSNCYFCHKTFRRSAQLSSHLRSHTLERRLQHQHRRKRRQTVVCHPRQCDLCGKLFRGTTTYLAHLKQVHQATPIEASLLPSVSTVQEDGSIRYTCPKCPKHFNRKDSLSQHLRCVHLLKVKLSLSCSVCGLRFKRSDVFKAHSHPDESDPCSVCYVCSICSKACVSRKVWRDHLRNSHERKCVQACHICHQCGKVLRSAFGLKHHVQSCSKSTTCETCGNVFPAHRDRIEHES